MMGLRADLDEGGAEFASSVAYAHHSSNVSIVDGIEECCHEVLLRVPSRATQICFGVVCHGMGSIDVEGLRLDVLGSIKPDPDPQAFIAEFVDVVQRNALNAEKLDWDRVRNDAERIAISAVASVDTYAFVRSTLRGLGDEHSSFATPEAASVLRERGTPTTQPRACLLAESTGYIKLPGFIGTDQAAVTRFGLEVGASVLELAHCATSWIVDLRECTGGNMWPLLASVRLLVGKGEVGSFRTRLGNFQPWSLAHSEGASEEMHRKISAQPIAVLIGSRTSSAGEAIAVAFHGRSRTRFFGENTAGRATANGAFDLLDGSQIHLTTAAFVDRRGQVFGKHIEPDDRASSDSGVTDKALESALNWTRSAESHA